MRHILLTSAAVMALVAPSYGAEQHRASLTATADQNIRIVPYSPTKRTSVTGIVGQPTTFTFPADEQIFGIAQSNKIKPDGSFADAGWHQPDAKDQEGKAVRMGNNLSLWPVAPGTTIMTVTTVTKDGTQKPYAFKLIAKPEPATPAGISLVNAGRGADMVDDPDATFNLIFKGGTPVASAEKAEHVSAGEAAADPIVAKPKHTKTRRQTTQEVNELEIAQDRIRTDAFNASGPCHFTAKGQHGPIEPLCPLDNGQWILIRIPGLAQKPSVFGTDPMHLCGADNGKYERYLRQHGAGDRIVVEEIASRLCLRLGENVLQLDDVNYNPAGAATGSGTIAASVNRQILKAQPE